MKTGEKRTALRSAILFPLGTVLLGGLLLLTWMSAMAAGERAGNSEAAQGLAMEPAVANVSADVAAAAAADAAAAAAANAVPKVDDLPLYAPPSLALEAKLAPPNAPLPLNITKSALPTTFTVGTNNIYFINVTRINTSTIVGAVRVEDPLPTGVTWIPANSGKWNCVDTSSRTLVSCYYTVNNPDTFDQISFKAIVAADVTPKIFNTAYILGDTPADNIPSNTVETNIDSVDLAILKTVWPESILTTGSVTYTLVITNYGPFIAKNVLVEDIRNTDLMDYHEFTTSKGTYNPADGTWKLAAMDIDEVQTLKIRATPKPAASGQEVINTAKISSSNYSDHYIANNTSSASVTVGGLDITKSVSKASARVGETFDFTILVRNSSASTISNIMVVDTINRGLDIISYYPGYYNSSTHQYIYSTSSMGSGNSVSILLTARVTDVISQTQAITNTATASWGPSYSISRVSNEVSVSVTPGGSLQVSKVDGITNVNPGQQVTYTLTITNSGNLDINTIRIEDTLSNNMSYVAMYPGTLTVSGSCSTEQFCVWAIPNTTLTPGQKISLRVVSKVSVSAVGGTTVNNSILVSATDKSGVRFSSSWTDTNVVNIVEETKMSIIMAVNPSQAQVDNNLTFKIEVQNLGNVSVTGVEVSASFPAVLDLTSVTTNKGTATLNTSAKTIHVDIGTLLSGQGAKITIITKVNSSATDIEIYETKAKLSWDPSLSLSSNQVRFRVLPASTLPGTGLGGNGLPGRELEEASSQASIRSLVAVALLLLGFGFFLAGLGLMVFGFIARGRRPLSAGRYTRSGIFLLAVALTLGLVVWAINGGTKPTTPLAGGQPQLSMLAGTKPPLATVPAPTLAPTPTQKPTQTVNPEEYLPTPTPLTLPDYPVPTPNIQSTEGPDGTTPDPSSVTRIVIPAMGLDTIVKYVPYNGQSWSIGGLKQEVAWMGDTSWPGLGGNTGLAGHVDLATGEAGPFWNLKDLKSGDEVVVYTEKNVYYYYVREQVIVNDYDMSVIEQTDEPQLTLITCTGWDSELSTYLQRLVVFADLTRVKALPGS